MPRNEAAETMATNAGFEIWTTGGGCMAFAKKLRGAEMPSGDVAQLDLMITDDGGTSISEDPEARVWFVGISYVDPIGGDEAATSARNLTLREALDAALELEKQADDLWEKHHDYDAIVAHENERNALRTR